MPEEKEQFTIVIIAVIIILLFLGILFLVMILYYANRRKLAQQEKEMLRQQAQAELVAAEFEVQEQTRRNLAADLHDNIGQILSLTNVTLGSINLDEPVKVKQKIKDTQELVTRSIHELRHLSKIIHGEQLIRTGLIEAIGQELTWLGRNDHYKIQFTHDIPETAATNADKDLFIYRVLQEALNNIIKHSDANTINISLILSNDNIELTITDNGVGFDAAALERQNRGMGLASMRKRIEMIQGRMLVQSEKNKGSSLTFTIPYP